MKRRRKKKKKVHFQSKLDLEKTKAMMDFMRIWGSGLEKGGNIFGTTSCKAYEFLNWNDGLELQGINFIK